MESVTLCSESQKEATSPMPFLSPKKISKTRTWNVRIMYKSNQCSYNTIVLALCETRWIQSGQVRLNTEEMEL